MKILRGTRPTIRRAVAVAKFLWPNFSQQHGCTFVYFTDDVPRWNRPPATETATDWESIANHTHIFDEFRNKATTQTVVGSTGRLTVVEETYDEAHPDFIAACELGRLATRLWALKLHQDFPNHRFRVYYTEYDNPIIRFHKVRDGEAHWLTDDALRTTTDPLYRNAIIYDTNHLSTPIIGPKLILN